MKKADHGKTNQSLFDYEGLRENFKFLILKIRQQLCDASAALELIEVSIPDKIRIREDYIDNLKMIIERKSYKKILNSNPDEKAVIRVMSAVIDVINNLEKIGDYATSIIIQTGYYKKSDFLRRFDHKAYFQEIFSTMEQIENSLFYGDIKGALVICKAELKLDRLFKADFDTLMTILERGTHTADAITTFNIIRYLERIGDSLLNIGEAILSAYIGTKIKIYEYAALKDTLETDLEDFRLENIGIETRSGCRIEKVVDTLPGSQQAVIFKEGDSAKVANEKEKINLWKNLMPDLVPSILGFQNYGNKSFILMEYLHGRNFQEILLGEDEATCFKVLKHITATLEEIWDKTRKDVPCQAGFMKQLQGKIHEVYDIHPSLQTLSYYIGAIENPPLETMIRKAEKIEDLLPAPFSVFIHGDFNTDNIIFDQTGDRLYFIDLNRSKNLDYIQDITVFAVSNFRIPIFSNAIRERLFLVIAAFLDFSRDYARRHHDHTFEARMALGLCRSFITSTRFEVKEDFAKEMFLRASYLLDKVTTLEGEDLKEFHVPMDLFAL
jgi:phosphate uptake regulator/aminoglycoside phosphotransferase (APT) family kinase protein